MNQIDLTKQRAIVTGGAQGIGRAIAERLLDSGAAVAVWDRDEAVLARALPALSARGRVAAIEVDVTEHGSVVSAVAETRARLGGFEILVNNAGISGPNAPTWESLGGVEAALAKVKTTKPRRRPAGNAKKKPAPAAKEKPDTEDGVPYVYRGGGKKDTSYNQVEGDPQPATQLRLRMLSNQW